MCGPSSAIGLDAAERALWPVLRERLRQSGRLMALLRGVLGGDTEVAVVAAVSPSGLVDPLALLVTPGIAAEIRLAEPRAGANDTWLARIGDDLVEVLTDATRHAPTPIAVKVSPWIRQHLTVYARRLWHRPGPP